MGILKNIGFVQKYNKTAKMFEDMFSPKTFLEVECKKPHEYFNLYCDKFKEQCPNMGRKQKREMFELLIRTLFYRFNLYPMYLHAQIAKVPNIEYDFVLYAEPHKVFAFTLMTEDNKRFKQADLEAVALKYVHPAAKCFLLTLNEDIAKLCSEKMEKGEYIGLNEVILCDSPRLDEMIENLQESTFVAIEA